MRKRIFYALALAITLTLALCLGIKVGEQQIGHEQKKVTIPKETGRGEILRCVFNDLDSMAIERITDTVNITPAQ